ncbi:MAG: response regulator [Gallionellaceae bacterium]
MIAEKHTLFRQVLKSFIATESGMEVVAEVESGNDLVSKLKQVEVDLLLLDMAMPGIASLKLISLIVSMHPELKILVLDKNSGSQQITQALKNGVRGFITADQDSNEFVKALHKVAQGERYIDPAIAEKLMFDNITGNDMPLHSHISPRELEVFGLLVAGYGVNKIADQLCISNKTVSTHKAKLMEKMHFASAADLIRYALQNSLFGESSVFSEDYPSRLRGAAEKLLANSPSQVEKHIATERLYHELQVHQIELEMQNQQLRHTQLLLEESRDRYLDMYEYAPAGYLTLSRDGLLTEINVTGTELLAADRKKLLDRRFDRHVIPEDRDRWNRQFLYAAQHRERQSCELSLQRGDGSIFSAHLDLQYREVATSATMRITLSDITK